MKSIKPETLVDMDLFSDECGFRIDLAYARPDNLLFGEQIYRTDARLWLHRDLAAIVCKAAQICRDQHGLRMVLYDGLRTVEAQEKMLHTQRVRDNPHWLEEPRLLSPPGGGGHPRGMAIDVSLETMDGELLDMGTPFDYLAEESGPDKNPAHRNYTGDFPPATIGHTTNTATPYNCIMKNRSILEQVMVEAAEKLQIALLPLPQEWWDFRLPPEIYEQYAPLSDADLPPDMRCL